MTENGVTKIRVEIWAVLGFLVLLGAISVGFLNAEQKETKFKQQEVISRVVVLETNQQYIVEGIRALKEGQKEVFDILVNKSDRKKTLKGAE